MNWDYWSVTTKLQSPQCANIIIITIAIQNHRNRHYRYHYHRGPEDKYHDKSNQSHLAKLGQREKN